MRIISCILAALLIAAAAYWLLATPEPRHEAVVGVLQYTSNNLTTLEGFKDGLAELGYHEGDNLKILFDGPAKSKEELAARLRLLLAKHPDLLFVSPTPAALVAAEMTRGTDLPVVFAPVNDPVASGVVNNLRRPEANLTGIRLAPSEGRRLQSLLEVAPGVHHVFVPYNPLDSSALATLNQLRRAAPALNVELLPKPFTPKTDLFAPEYVPEGIDAVFLPREGLVLSRIKDFVSLCSQRKLAISTPRFDQVEQGALTGLGFIGYEVGRQAARLAHLLLSGTPVASLPVETAEGLSVHQPGRCGTPRNPSPGYGPAPGGPPDPGHRSPDGPMTRLDTLLRRIFMTLAVGPLLVAGALLGWHAYSVQVNTAFQYEDARAGQVAQQIQKLFGEIERDVRSVGRFDDFSALPTTRQREMLQKILSDRHMIRDITVVAPTGRELLQVSSVQVPEATPARDWNTSVVFYSSELSRDSNLGPIRIDPATGEPLARISVPFEDLHSGDLRLVLVATLRIKYLWDIIAAHNAAQASRVFVTDADGRIVAHSNPSLVLSGAVADLRSEPALQSNSAGRTVIAAQRSLFVRPPGAGGRGGTRRPGCTEARNPKRGDLLHADHADPGCGGGHGRNRQTTDRKPHPQAGGNSRGHPRRRPGQAGRKRLHPGTEHACRELQLHDRPPPGLPAQSRRGSPRARAGRVRAEGQRGAAAAGSGGHERRALGLGDRRGQALFQRPLLHHARLRAWRISAQLRQLARKAAPRRQGRRHRQAATPLQARRNLRGGVPHDGQEFRMALDSRPGQGRAARPGQRASAHGRHPRGHHGTQAFRTGRPAGQGGGRSRQPGQVRIPDQHEPRNPHPHERSARPAPVAGNHPPRRRTAKVHRRSHRVGKTAGGAAQRHPRSFPGGGREAGNRRGGCGNRTAGAQRPGDLPPRDHEQGAAAGLPDRTGRAACLSHRRRQTPAGALQSRGQFREIHGPGTRARGCAPPGRPPGRRQAAALFRGRHRLRHPGRKKSA